jgi:hypothetical protein
MSSYKKLDGTTVNESVAAYQPLPGFDRNASIQATVNEVARIFAPFNVEVLTLSGAGRYDTSSPGSTTIFIGADPNNKDGTGTKVPHAFTPFDFVDAPGVTKGYQHAPNSDAYDLAFVDPVSYDPPTRGQVTVESPVQIGRDVAHEAGHTFGLEHVLTSPNPDIMSYDFYGSDRFADATYPVTDLNYSPSHNPPTYNGGDAFFAEWKDTASGPVQKITTQNSYTYLTAVLGPNTDQVATALKADGRLELFKIGADHALYVQQQVNPGGVNPLNPFTQSWTPFQYLGGFVRQIKAARDADGRVEVFAIGSDNSVWHMTQSLTGAWSGWQALGGWARQIDVGTNADGHLEVFAIGADYAMWHTWQAAPNSAVWTGWYSFGGYVKQIAVGRDLDRRLEVFAINANNGVSNIWQLTGGGWSGWNNGLGGFVKQIAISNEADGRLDLFAVNAINGVSHIAQVVPNGNWGGWDNSLGGFVWQITVDHNADGRLDLFGIGADHAVWHKYQAIANSTLWTGWYNHGGYVSSIVVGNDYDGRIELFGVTGPGSLFRRWQVAPNGAWNSLPVNTL